MFEMNSSKINSMKAKGRDVIVQVFDKREVSSSGLFVGVFDRNPIIPDRGLVVSVGPDVKEKEIVPGKKVMFERYKGKKIENMENNEIFLVLPEYNVVAIMDDAADISIHVDQRLRSDFTY